MATALKHWRNKTDSGQPKYSEEDLSQCHFAPTNFRNKTWDRFWASKVRGRRLTFRFMSHPQDDENILTLNMTTVW